MKIIKLNKNNSCSFEELDYGEVFITDSTYISLMVKLNDTKYLILDVSYKFRFNEYPIGLIGTYAKEREFMNLDKNYFKEVAKLIKKYGTPILLNLEDKTCYRLPKSIQRLWLEE